MLVSDAIRQIKATLNDDTEEFTGEHYLDFINHAIQEIGSLLIGGRFAPMVKEIIIEDGDMLPKNFSMFAGRYPIRITGQKCEIIDEDEYEIRCRYFATPDIITIANYNPETTELPFYNDAVCTVMVRLATIYALNENEYDISADNVLKQEIQQAVAAALGAAGA